MANWWWRIDKTIFMCAILLLSIGFLLSFAASPAVAYKLGLSDYYFVVRQLVFSVLAFFIMLLISLLSINKAKGLALVLFVISYICLILTLFWGAEIKGARRWITLLGISIQPSELLKPVLVVLLSTLFAKWVYSRKTIYLYGAALLVALVLAILLCQPDFGQTMLISLVVAVLLFLLGVSLLWVPIILLSMSSLLFAAYYLLPHVRGRITSFLTGSGNTFQVDMGKEAILNGGWFGLGPGEGVVKKLVPDSHTDFIFSVAAEEYGMFFCLFIVILFLILIGRSLYIAGRARDVQTKLTIGGLSCLLGMQAFINIFVNLHLLPAKGMTLPFISYGGSSLVAVAVTIGLLLVFTSRSIDIKIAKQRS